MLKRESHRASMLLDLLFMLFILSKVFDLFSGEHKLNSVILGRDRVSIVLDVLDLRVVIRIDKEQNV